MIDSIDFYVSLEGNDLWSGRLSEPNADRTDGPFASLHRALEAIRRLECKNIVGELRRPVNVFIRGGTYYLKEPLTFKPEDSGTTDCPVTFRAYMDEKPVISGGRLISNWEVKDGHGAHKVWSAKLPDVASGKWFFRTLRVGKSIATKARYPKPDPDNPKVNRWLFVSESTPKDTYDRIMFRPGELPEWTDWDDVEVHIFPAWGWVNAILEVKGVDRSTNSLIVDCKQDIRPGNRFFLANTKEALNMPGEWCLDRKTGELLYIPENEEFPNVDVVAPVMKRLIVLQGDAENKRFVENIRFIGLEFSDADYTLDGYYTPADAAIWLTCARNCIIDSCKFANLSGYAVRLEQRSNANRITNNLMIGLGQGGVILLGDAKSQPYDNYISGNVIHDCGKIYKHVAGVYVTTGSNNIVSHNSICCMPRYGISFKSYDKDAYSHNNIAEYNEIINSNLETNDTGAIETLGRDMELSGNIIRFNYIKNVVGLGTTPEGAMLTPYFTWGIYLDDYSSGTTVYGNIVDGTTLGAVCIHGGKENVVENNIFMNGKERQITLQPRDDFMTGNIVQRNIFVYEDRSAVIWYSWQNTWRRDRLSRCDYNVYWNNSGLDILSTEMKITPEGNFTSWKDAGFDNNSIVADPLIGDKFELKEGSPALKLGFKPIPFDLIGPKGLKAKK